MANAISLVILLGLLWLFVSLWVSRDASKNSPHSAFLWGLAVFVGGFLGLILYFILGREKKADSDLIESKTQQGLVKCPNCHALEDPKRDVCRFCKEPITDT